MKHLLRALLLSFTLFLVSCGPDYIFDQSYAIEPPIWNYNDTLNFTVDIQDSLSIYNLYLDVEHATDFYSQNMYVMIHTAFPSGKRIREQVSLELANKGGVWFGDCNSDWCSLRIPIQTGAYFNAVGKHTITLEQFTRIDALKGIRRIGFKVEDTGERRNVQ